MYVRRCRPLHRSRARDREYKARSRNNQYKMRQRVEIRLQVCYLYKRRSSIGGAPSPPDSIRGLETEAPRAAWLSTTVMAVMVAERGASRRRSDSVTATNQRVPRACGRGLRAGSRIVLVSWGGIPPSEVEYGDPNDRRRKRGTVQRGSGATEWDGGALFRSSVRAPKRFRSPSEEADPGRCT